MHANVGRETRAWGYVGSGREACGGHADHHWQHWLLAQPDGTLKPLKMPWMCVREMVADWAAAGRAITGKREVRAWYAQNRDQIVLHPATRGDVEALLEAFFSDDNR